MLIYCYAYVEWFYVMDVLNARTYYI